MINRYSDRFTERLPARGFSGSDLISLDEIWNPPENEIWDKIDKRVIPRSYFKEAMDSRVRELDASMRRFMDCGVELARFSIQEHPGESRLCVDGVPRFAWRMQGFPSRF